MCVCVCARARACLRVLLSYVCVLSTPSVPPIQSQGFHSPTLIASATVTAIVVDVAGVGGAVAHLCLLLSCKCPECAHV